MVAPSGDGGSQPLHTVNDAQSSARSTPKSLRFSLEMKCKIPKVIAEDFEDKCFESMGEEFQEGAKRGGGSLRTIEDYRGIFLESLADLSECWDNSGSFNKGEAESLMSILQRGDSKASSTKKNVTNLMIGLLESHIGKSSGAQPLSTQSEIVTGDKGATIEARGANSAMTTEEFDSKIQEGRPQPSPGLEVDGVHENGQSFRILLRNSLGVSGNEILSNAIDANDGTLQSVTSGKLGKHTGRLLFSNAANTSNRQKLNAYRELSGKINRLDKGKLTLDQFKIECSKYIDKQSSEIKEALQEFKKFVG
jgi:hypothetical protein